MTAGRKTPARDGLSRTTRGTASRPRTGRPQGASAAVTRRKILDAARALFSDWGYDATRIKDVALKAGVNAALVHHYFGDKDDLYQTVLTDAVKPLRVLGARLLVKGLPMDMLLAAWVEVLCTYFERHKDIVWLITRECLGNAGRVRAILVDTMGPLFAQTVESLQAGMPPGPRAKVDPAFLVVNTLGMLAIWHTHTTLIDAVLGENSQSPANRLRMRQQIMVLLTHGAMGRPL